MVDLPLWKYWNSQHRSGIPSCSTVKTWIGAQSVARYNLCYVVCKTCTSDVVLLTAVSPGGNIDFANWVQIILLQCSITTFSRLINLKTVSTPVWVSRIGLAFIGLETQVLNTIHHWSPWRVLESSYLRRKDVLLLYATEVAALPCKGR